MCTYVSNDLRNMKRHTQKCVGDRKKRIHPGETYRHKLQLSEEMKSEGLEMAEEKYHYAAVCDVETLAEGQINETFMDGQLPQELLDRIVNFNLPEAIPPPSNVNALTLREKVVFCEGSTSYSPTTGIYRMSLNSANTADVLLFLIKMLCDLQCKAFVMPKLVLIEKANQIDAESEVLNSHV